MTTRGEAISRLRNVLKAVKEDPFMTDRFLFSMIMKYAKLLIRRQDNEDKIIRYEGIYQYIPCVELIELDRIPACCTGIRTGCTIRRTKDPIPDVLEGSRGPILRSVASLDLSVDLQRISPAGYANLTKMSSFKYNKTKYYWLLDGYIYVPDVEWEGIYVEAIFNENLAKYVCDKDADLCTRAQDLPLNVPEYLMAEVEQMVLQELVPTTAQLPSDGADDAQNVLR